MEEKERADEEEEERREDGKGRKRKETFQSFQKYGVKATPMKSQTEMKNNKLLGTREKFIEWQRTWLNCIQCYMQDRIIQTFDLKTSQTPEL